MSATGGDVNAMDSKSQQMTHDEYLNSTFAVAKNDYTLGDVDLARACPLDNSTTKQEPQHDLSIFDNLPLELQQAIFSQIDLQTLVNFRRVNRRAHQIVDSMPEYRNIIKHFPDALRAALSIEVASNFSCLELWTALTHAECADCGDFGGFIYLPTCRRVCFPCILGRHEYFPLTPSEAARKFGLTQAAVKKLPMMRTVPGLYSFFQHRYRGRVTLVDRETAHRAGLAHHGSQVAIKMFVERKQSKQFDKYEARKARVASEHSNARVRRPNYLDPPDQREGNVKRFMTVMRAPVIDKCTMAIVEGRHCRGCVNGTQRRREFTAETLAKHIEESTVAIQPGGHVAHIQ